MLIAIHCDWSKVQTVLMPAFMKIHAVFTSQTVGPADPFQFDYACTFSVTVRPRSFLNPKWKLLQSTKNQHSRFFSTPRVCVAIVSCKKERNAATKCFQLVNYFSLRKIPSLMDVCGLIEHSRLH